MHDARSERWANASVSIEHRGADSWLVELAQQRPVAAQGLAHLHARGLGHGLQRARLPRQDWRRGLRQEVMAGIGRVWRDTRLTFYKYI